MQALVLVQRVNHCAQSISHSFQNNNVNLRFQMAAEGSSIIRSVFSSRKTHRNAMNIDFHFVADRCNEYISGLHWHTQNTFNHNRIISAIAEHCAGTFGWCLTHSSLTASFQNDLIPSAPPSPSIDRVNWRSPCKYKACITS